MLKGTMKKCSNKKCSKENPQTKASFYKNAGTFDGLNNQCKTCLSTHISKWKKDNRARVNESRRGWRGRYREKHLDDLRKWRAENPEKTQLYGKARVAAIAIQTPAWLSKEQKKEMADLKKMAKEISWLSESPLEIDHIVPLQGRGVRGLHVPWNLQIIPKSMNMSKFISVASK